MAPIPKIKMDAGEVEIVDIPTMHGLSDEEYRDYIRADGLVFVDHHEILRSAATGIPLAATLEQLNILIEELQGLRGKMISRDTK